jgi:hypothetical protein
METARQRKRPGCGNKLAEPKNVETDTQHYEEKQIAIYVTQNTKELKAEHFVENGQTPW